MKRRIPSIIIRSIIIALFLSSTMSCDSSSYKSAWQNTVESVKSKTKSLKDKTESLTSSLTSKNSNGDEKQIKAATSKELHLLADRGVISPESLTRSLELQPRKEYKDFIDLGTCYVWIGNYEKAAEAYEMAARQAKETDELTGALYNKAVAIAYVDINKSLPAVDLASRVSPKNLEVARLRAALHQKSSNQLGQIAANNHLSSLDSSVIGHEVMDLWTATVLVAVVYGATTVSVVALTPPEKRADIVVPMMTGYYATTSTTTPGGSATFARKLLEEKI